MRRMTYLAQHEPLRKHWESLEREALRKPAKWPRRTALVTAVAWLVGVAAWLANPRQQRPLRKKVQT